MRKPRRKLLPLLVSAAVLWGAMQLGGLPLTLSIAPRIIFPNLELPPGLDIFGPRDKKIITVRPADRW